MEESTEGGLRMRKEKGLDNLIGLTGDHTEGLGRRDAAWIWNID